jgi:hypothetical protein
MKGRMTMKMKYLAASFATLVIGGLGRPTQGAGRVAGQHKELAGLPDI